MNNIRTLRSLRLTLNTLCVLLLIIPFQYTFGFEGGEEAPGVWSNDYILSNLSLSCIFMPFFLAWISLPFIKTRILLKLAKVIGFLDAAFIFLLSFGSLSIPMQDLQPHYGMLVSLGLLPLFSVYLWFSRKEKSWT